MSNLDPAPEAINLTPGVVRAVDVVEGRKAAIGDGTEVRRLLPQRTLPAPPLPPVSLKPR